MYMCCGAQLFELNLFASRYFTQVLVRDVKSSFQRKIEVRQ